MSTATGSDETTSEAGGITEAKDYTGKVVAVEREYTATEQLQGTCLEVNEKGVLIRSKARGHWVTDFLPWEEIKRVRYTESEMTRHSRG